MNNQGDLISRSALKEEIVKLCEQINLYSEKTVPTLAFIQIINNAPTVEYPFYQEAYQTGYEEGKEDVIHSIAKQYNAHNELVPIWLSIGDLKGGAV